MSRMFGRQSDDEPDGPEDVEGETVGQGERPVGVEADIDEMMRRLDEVSGVDTAARMAPLERLSSEAADHAESLRATLSAQKQAQRMLALATKVRGEASVQGEQILQEAQTAASRLRAEAEREADRVRKEMADWADAQRRTIEDGISELINTANQDAEQIRADALRTSMDEARETARNYLERAAEEGERDAEAVRAEARDVLARSAAKVSDTHRTIRQFTDLLASFLVTLQRQLDDVEELNTEAQDRSHRAGERRTTVAGAGDADADELDEDLDEDTDDTDEDTGEGEGLTGSAAARETANGPENGPENSTANGAAESQAETDGGAAVDVAEKPASDEPSRKGTPSTRPQQGRPLGSLFRQPGPEDRDR